MFAKVTEGTLAENFELLTKFVSLQITEFQLEFHREFLTDEVATRRRTARSLTSSWTGLMTKLKTSGFLNSSSKAQKFTTINKQCGLKAGRFCKLISCHRSADSFLFTYL